MRHLQTVGGAALSTNDSLTADEEPTSPPQLSRPGRRLVTLVVVGLAVLVLVIDVVTKQLAVSMLADRPPVRLLGGAVYLLVTRNSGAAFSFAADYTYVFSIVAVAVVGWIGWMTRYIRSIPWAVALGFVLGGTIGNLADRVFRAPGPFFGHVVDFVSIFDAAGQGFPVFNVADSALSIGVALAVLLELRGLRRDGS